MMIAKRHYGYVAFFVCHFLLLGTICLHETLRLFESRMVAFPASAKLAWAALDKVPAALAGDEADLNLAQKAIVTYTNAAGIQAGYGYFAPNIPPSHALVFEFKYRNGRVEYESPRVTSQAAEVRLSSLLAQMAEAELPEWREELIRLLARSSWRLHPEAISARAFFGSLVLPSVSEYKAGKRARVFNSEYVYDFDQSKAERAVGNRGKAHERSSLPR